MGKAFRKKNGFIMLETLLISSILLLFSGAVLSASAVYGRGLRKRAAKNVAFDTALGAVRLMAGEVMKKEQTPEGEYISNGMEPVDTELIAEAVRIKEDVSFPVKIWSVRKEDVLILYAQAEVDRYRECVYMELREHEQEEITPSDPSGWVLYRYGRQLSEEAK